MKFVLIAAVLSLALTQVSAANNPDSLNQYFADLKTKTKESLGPDVQNFFETKQQELIHIQEQAKAVVSNIQNQARPVMEDIQKKVDHLFNKMAEQAQRQHQHQHQRHHK